MGKGGRESKDGGRGERKEGGVAGIRVSIIFLKNKRLKWRSKRASGFLSDAWNGRHLWLCK